ncbi:hypothetical protein [Nonomuraea lactucae]|nr:hypothetical protein [Nonomuraea lactucae]
MSWAGPGLSACISTGKLLPHSAHPAGAVLRAAWKTYGSVMSGRGP